MSRFLLVSCIAILFSIATTSVYAESGATTTGATTTGATTTGTLTMTPSVSLFTPLLLDTVVATDTKTITLTFNQPIRVDSIRVRIIDQATNESIRVSSITGSTTSTAVAVITTSATLTSGTSYVITITSALSTTDMTIKAGVDSIREFIAPVAPPAETTLNAPANPSAVMAATGTSAVAAKGAVASGSTVIAAQDIDGALPATGAPTVILILLAGLSAFTLLMFRKKA